MRRVDRLPFPPDTTVGALSGPPRSHGCKQTVKRVLLVAYNFAPIAASVRTRDERLGVSQPNRDAVIEEALASLVAGRTRIEAPSSRDVQRFHYRALTGQLADVLNAVVAK